MAYLTSLEIGTTSTTTNVEALTGNPYPPFCQPLGYPVRIATAAGTVREQGGNQCAWTFRALTDAQWDALRTIIPGASATVYIRTLSEDNNTYVYKTGTAIWPEPGDIERPTSSNFICGQMTIRFINLVTFTP